LSKTKRFFENWLETARSGLRSRSNLPLVTPVGPFPALNVPGFLKVPSPLLVSTPTLPGALRLETARFFLPPLLKSAAVSVVGPPLEENALPFLKVPSPLPRRTETLLESAFAVAKSSLPSPSSRQTMMAWGVRSHRHVAGQRVAAAPCS
jgi:hypothetical protein